MSSKKKRPSATSAPSTPATATTTTEASASRTAGAETAAATEQRHGLIRAIYEEPWDDAPRLIYADWLEEHGQPERAEFIRRTIAYERAVAGRSDAPDPYRVAPKGLEEELHDLLEVMHRYGREWIRPLIKDWCLLSRGFVSDVFVLRSEFSKVAADLFRTHPIISVALVTVGRALVGMGVHPWQPPSLLLAGGSRTPKRCVPVEILPYLDKVGMPVVMRDNLALAPADSAVAEWGLEIVSRAAVAYGRNAAGLQPLTPEQYGSVWDRRWAFAP
jgi:uncharacterized protein (TIGR02996 family)